MGITKTEVAGFWLLYKNKSLTIYLNRPNDPWVELHMWPQQAWGQRSSRGQWPLVQGFEKKGHCIHKSWCIFMGLGHNDPWVVSHMWPQQAWGQRSSRGKWPLVQVLVWGQIWYYNVCKSMWSRKQVRLVIQEPPYLKMWFRFIGLRASVWSMVYRCFKEKKAELMQI